ncbi:hypothetical protein HY641_02310 [Candidatus Woesearchaeota archaeon]|nr:hypothetical protein [Candidatus Woesearchaeota archaeon]
MKQDPIDLEILIANPTEVTVIQECAFFDMFAQQEMDAGNVEGIRRVLEGKLGMLHAKQRAMDRTRLLLKTEHRTDVDVYKTVCEELEYLRCQVQDTSAKLQNPDQYRSWKFY